MSAIDLAVLDALRNDATLQTLAPGGVYRDIAPESAVDASEADPANVFGVVTLQSSLSRYSLPGTVAFESCRFLVKFVSPSTSPTGAVNAWTRAETVLAALAVTGWKVSCSRREERIAYVEVDAAVRWQHRGCSWLVEASPA